METISILWQFQDLACDWSENNEHSRHILGVHSFSSLTVKLKLSTGCDHICIFDHTISSIESLTEFGFTQGSSKGGEGRGGVR